MQEMNEIEPDLLPGGGKLWISSDQVTGMIEWELKSKPEKIPWDSNKTAKKSLHQNLTKNPMLNFRTIKIFQKALYDITRK